MNKEEHDIKKMSNEELDEYYLSLTKGGKLTLGPTAKEIQDEMLSRYNNFFNKDKTDSKEDL